MVDAAPRRRDPDRAAGRAGELSLRRFATASFPIVVGTLQGAARLAIPHGSLDRPWQLQVDADGPVTVCPV